MIIEATMFVVVIEVCYFAYILFRNHKLKQLQREQELLTRHDYNCQCQECKTITIESQTRNKHDYPNVKHMVRSLPSEKR